MSLLLAPSSSSIVDVFFQATKDTPGASASGKITDWVKPDDKSGEFKRQQSSFRDWISRESGAKFPPEKGRYHLYVSYACPWVSEISLNIW